MPRSCLWHKVNTHPIKYRKSKTIQFHQQLYHSKIKPHLSFILLFPEEEHPSRTSSWIRNSRLSASRPHKRSRTPSPSTPHGQGRTRGPLKRRGTCGRGSQGRPQESRDGSSRRGPRQHTEAGAAAQGIMWTRKVREGLKGGRRWDI